MRNNGFLEETLIDDTSITADIISRTVDLADHPYWAIQLDWTSTTAAAEVKIDGSNDGINWRTFNAPDNTDILNDSGTIIRTTSEYDASGSGRFDPRYLRVWLDVASGSITTVTAKMFARNY